MDDRHLQPQLPWPVQVLSYADNRVHQPATSRFVCVIRHDGGTFTEAPFPGAGLAYTIAGVLMLLASVAGAISLTIAESAARHRYWEDYLLFLPVGLLMFTGIVALFQASALKRNPIIFDVHEGALRVSLPKLLFRHKRFFLNNRLKITVSIGHTGISMRRQSVAWLASVRVHRNIPLVYTQILVNRPRDECIWIVNELNFAIERCKSNRAVIDKNGV